MDTCCNSTVGYQFNCQLSGSSEGGSLPIGCLPSDRCSNVISPSLPIIDTTPAPLNTPLPADYFNAVLRYLNCMLMEEDLEQRTYIHQDSNALHAAEKSFYDALKGTNKTSSSNSLTSPESVSSDSPKEIFDFSSGEDLWRSWNLDQGKFDPYQLENSLISHQLPPANLPSYPHSMSFGNDLFKIKATQLITKSLGNEDAVEDIGPNVVGKKITRSRVDEDDGHEIERRAKQNANFISDNLDELADKYDRLLLCSSMNPGYYVKSSICDIDPTEDRYSPPIILPHEPKRGRPRASDKKLNLKQVVDLNSLIIQCADTVVSYDNSRSSQLLNQIRQHSSPYGNANERLTYYFANALEARISGIGTTLYSGFNNKRVSAAETLKAYETYFVSCPFRRMSNIFGSKCVGLLTKKAKTIHVIDFGIDLGFQWPCFIQGISIRPEGPPNLRITGIELPQPGFRPAERVEETGRRLSHYCKRFNVPFEYHAIAKKWETITLDELNIDRNDTIIVNCMYKLRHVSDEATDNSTQRDKVLKLIHDIKPDIFIHGILNGSYNTPFFGTRFREALFQFSSLFDMFEKTLPSEDKERLVLEKELGREAMNVIACEGSERIERPESYKKWQVRNRRAGFRQVPLLPQVVEEVRAKVKVQYHKDFLVDEDSDWILQGWKGRVTHAISCWKPVYDE